MHFDNLKQFLPELNAFFILFCIVFIYAEIVVTKNYFKAISDVYEVTDYKIAKLMGGADKIIITFLLLLPLSLGTCLVVYPFEFEVVDGKAIVNDYSGQGNVKIPQRLLFWEVTSISEGAFENNTKITEIIIPETVTHIRNYAFANAVNLEKVIYTENVTTIGNFAFANCKKLSDVSMPGEKTDVGIGAFCNTKWLYYRQENYVVLGRRHYIYIGDENEVVVPDGIQTVDFYLNKKIEVVTLPESIVDYIPYCFQGCSSLSDMPLPNDAHWSAYCFGGCGRLTSIEGKNLALHGDIRACDVDRPFEIDDEFRRQCRIAAGVKYNAVGEDSETGATNIDSKIDLVEPEKVEVEKAPDYLECISAYKDFISNYKPEYEDAIYTPRYGCVYIDDDGLPELLIANNPNHTTGVKVFSYINGIVVEIGIFGQYGCVRYAELNNMLAEEVFYNGGAGGVTYYTYQKGVIKQKGTVFASTKGSYRVDDMDVSEEVYLKKTKEYAGDFEYKSFDYMDAFDLFDESGFETKIDE